MYNQYLISIIFQLLIFIAKYIPLKQLAFDDSVSPEYQKFKVDKLPKIIKFEKVEHDYGNILKGDDGTCEFRFTNVGKTDLILTNVRSSCGCTVPSWPKESIAPGQSSVIKVKYNTQRIGLISKSITVESNAINNRVVLRIKGNVADVPQEAAPVKTESSVVAPQ